MSLFLIVMDFRLTANVLRLSELRRKPSGSFLRRELSISTRSLPPLPSSIVSALSLTQYFVVSLRETNGGQWRYPRLTGEL